MLQGYRWQKTRCFRCQYTLAMLEFYEGKELGNYVSVLYVKLCHRIIYLSPSISKCGNNIQEDNWI